MTHRKIRDLLDQEDGPAITLDDWRLMIAALRRGDPERGIEPRPDVADRVMDDFTRKALGYASVPLSAEPDPVEELERILAKLKAERVRKPGEPVPEFYARGTGR